MLTNKLSTINKFLYNDVTSVSLNINKLFNLFNDNFRGARS